METNFELTVKRWLDNHNETVLDLEDLLGEIIEISDERGVYYIEALYFDDDGDMWGWCMDKDGGEYEVAFLSLCKEDENKILEKLKDYEPPAARFDFENYLRQVYDTNPLF